MGHFMIGRQAACVVCLSIVTSLGAVGCFRAPENPEQQLIGKWTVPGKTQVMEFLPDGKFVLKVTEEGAAPGEYRGTWRIEEGELIETYEEVPEPPLRNRPLYGKVHRALIVDYTGDTLLVRTPSRELFRSLRVEENQ